MPKITQILSREILNSRGTPTVETTIVLDNDMRATASVPAGKSKSSFEAVEIVDRDEKRYGGLGMLTAVKNVTEIISPHLIGLEVTAQAQIDTVMINLDGTPNKAKLGGNAILSVSTAVARAAAKSQHVPVYQYISQYSKDDGKPLHIPIPVMNIFNGGMHGGRNVDFQEFAIIPASSKQYCDSLQMGSAIYFSLKKLLGISNLSTLLGDEGGFAPVLPTNNEALTLIKKAIDDSGYKLGLDVFLGIDFAASTFQQGKKYSIKDKRLQLSSKDLIEYYDSLNKAYHFLYLEDPLGEEDWDGWVEMRNNSDFDAAVLVGDDLVSTNPQRLQMAIDKKAITGVIIKPSQIGTIIESIAVAEIARAAGLKIVVSHRSGETNDDFIADFGVGMRADYVKFGAPARGERVAKYNRLLAIEQQIANSK